VLALPLPLVARSGKASFAWRPGNRCSGSGTSAPTTDGPLMDMSFPFIVEDGRGTTTLRAVACAWEVTDPGCPYPWTARWPA